MLTGAEFTDTDTGSLKPQACLTIGKILISKYGQKL